MTLRTSTTRTTTICKYEAVSNTAYRRTAGVNQTYRYVLRCAKAATQINAALDATDSVEIDINMLEPDADPNMIIISLGLLAIGKIGQELNL